MFCLSSIGLIVAGFASVFAHSPSYACTLAASTLCRPRTPAFDNDYAIYQDGRKRDIFSLRNSVASDNESTWHALRMALPGIINFNLFGVSLVGPTSAACPATRGSDGGCVLTNSGAGQPSLIGVLVGQLVGWFMCI